MPKKYRLALLSFSSLSLMLSSLPAQGNPSNVHPDGSTQTNIVGGVQCTTDCTISGSSRAGNNLFHSFSEFSIPSNVTVTFTDDGAANIFTRVSKRASHINGSLAVTGTGDANFFLLNPHGIVFGPNSSLATTGSFIASTADSLQFSDGVNFIAAESVPPLLTISTPTGLYFDALSGAITNQSQVGLSDNDRPLQTSAGLHVDTGKTLAFLGNGIFLENGSLTAFGGKILLGSVATNSQVSLTPDFSFEFESTQSFQDIYLENRSVLDTSGDGGRISLNGRHILMGEQVSIANLTKRDSETSQIDIFADESIEINGGVIFFSPSFEEENSSSGANFNISTKRLKVTGGAIISGGTTGSGRGGRLRINASESIEISGARSFSPSLLTTSTEGFGSGGDIEINTQRLSVFGGAQIQSVTYGPGEGGNLIVNVNDFIEISGTAEIDFRGEVSSGILASSGIEGFPFQPTGDGGNLTINTDKLLINDGASVSVNSVGSGDAGDLKINARSVRLDAGAQLTAAAEFGNGGNLRLSNLETLLLRRGGGISTRAGAGDGQGNGGNIFIDADFIVAGSLEDSDIVAKATRGRGGNIEIMARGLYGIQPRPATLNNGTNDIDASSDFGISGTTRINRLTSETDLELINIADRPLKTDGTVSEKCGANGNSFVVTARGGLPAAPTNPVENHVPLVDLGGASGTATDVKMSSFRSLIVQQKTRPWVEAIGWKTDEHGQVSLVASQSERTGPLVAANCTG